MPGYTLLLVESPGTASRLQSLVPAHVYVIATSGYLWYPEFDSRKLRLKRKAIPEKSDLRSHIRQEATNAVRIILAADSDPSGNFIAWSLAKEFKNRPVFRANLTSLNKHSVSEMISGAAETEPDVLHQKLENRFIIRELWRRYNPGISMVKAALATIFTTESGFQLFVSNQGTIYKSQRPVQTQFGSIVEPFLRCDDVAYTHYVPLSTYDAVDLIQSELAIATAEEAQLQLYELFTTVDPLTEKELITYPRTSANAFFPGSWDQLHHQWIRKRSIDEFVPPTLQNIAPVEMAHDAIRPADINLSPDEISKRILSPASEVYRVIHNHTRRAISMPDPSPWAYISAKHRCTVTGSAPLNEESTALRPAVTVSDLGRRLDELGVLRPSGFGKCIDQAAEKQMITLSPAGCVAPGEALHEVMKNGRRYKRQLLYLKEAADDPTTTAETITGILTSQ
ncbi:MAG: hypothetical protein GVY08_09985 [Bacteroidetes bacterium]|nr:hypothetical protein [Bacteroidota bacterium]